MTADNATVLRGLQIALELGIRPHEITPTIARDLAHITDALTEPKDTTP